MDTTELTEEQVAFVQRLMQAAGDDGVCVFTETVTLEDGTIRERKAELRPDQFKQEPKRNGYIAQGRHKCHRCGDVCEESVRHTERGTRRKVYYCFPCADVIGNQTVYDVMGERRRAGYYNRPRNKVCI